MRTTYTVKLTTIRYTSPAYEVPTIEIAVTPGKGEKFTHPSLMASAHLMASTLWATNVQDREIGIENQGNGIVWVTMDIGRDDAEQGKILDLMRRIVPTPEADEKPAKRVRVTQPQA